MRISLRVAGVVTALAAVGGLASACDWPASALHNVTIRDAATGVTGIGSTIPAGQYQFSVGSSVSGGSLQIARVAPDYSVAQTLRDVAAAFGPHTASSSVATQRLYSHVAFVGGLSGSGSYSTYLSPGKYFAIDTVTNKLEQFTVMAAKALPNFPKATLQVSGGMSMPNGMDHFAWRVTGTFAKSGVIKFSTVSGDEPHFLDVAYIHAGKTAADCLDYQGAPAGAPCDELLETGIVSPLQSMTIPYSFPKSGAYVITCFMPDDDSGTPHALLGMTSTFILH
jgi:hypothetical protein